MSLLQLSTDWKCLNLKMPEPEMDSKSRILIIDDDQGMSYMLARMVQEVGHGAATASTLGDGQPLALTGEYDVVFLDMRLPDGNGLEIIPKIQSMPYPPEIIIITAHGDKKVAKTALKGGVWDYIEKPASIDAMKLSLTRALQYRGQKETLNTPISVKRAGIIGSSSKLLMCITLMAHAAQSEANVLISGETGTGKEMFARAIHLNSARASKPFVVVDCASLPLNIAESILFGHVKGAFTGADKSKIGLIEQAHGGTLFLDEIGELPLYLQKTFLRVLQERRFRPVGGGEEIGSNFRLVSATNRNMGEEVDKELFRQDLLYRLRTFVIELPPLREREKDIHEIAENYVIKLCERSGLEHKIISDEFHEVLARYNWPGNVRELLSTLERSVALEPQYPTLVPKHLPDYIRANIIAGENREPANNPYHRAGPTESIFLETSNPLPTMKDFRQKTMESAEKLYLRHLLEQCECDIAQACEVSGLKRSRLYQLLKDHGFAKTFKK